MLLITFSPATNAMPEVGFISPVSILNVVVFPAPLTPSNPKTSPLLTLNETLSTATLYLPYPSMNTLRTSLTRMAKILGSAV